MMTKVMAGAVAVLVSMSAGAVDLQVKPSAPGSAAVPAAASSTPPPATSAVGGATTAGVILGATAMLIGTWASTPRAARNWTRGGLCIAIAFPLVGVSMDMQSSSTWEAVPSR